MSKLFRALGLFWAIVVSGTGLVGGYFGAVAAGAEFFFWLVVGIGAVVALTFWLGPLVLKAAQKIQNYDRLLTSVATLTDRLKAADESVALLELAASGQRDQGILEGQARVLGAGRAAAFDPPRVVGVSELAGEVLLNATSPHPIEHGARYIVRSTNTEQAWGIVEILDTDLNGTTNKFTLRCVQAIVPRFWEKLASRVGEDDSAPKDIRLESFTLDFDSNPIVQQSPTVTDATFLEVPNGSTSDS